MYRLASHRWVARIESPVGGSEQDADVSIGMVLTIGSLHEGTKLDRTPTCSVNCVSIGTELEIMSKQLRGASEAVNT